VFCWTGLAISVAMFEMSGIQFLWVPREGSGWGPSWCPERRAGVHDKTLLVCEASPCNSAAETGLLPAILCSRSLPLHSSCPLRGFRSAAGGHVPLQVPKLAGTKGVSDRTTPVPVPSLTDIFQKSSTVTENTIRPNKDTIREGANCKTKALEPEFYTSWSQVEEPPKLLHCLLPLNHHR
jgi:hypothetical protein